MKILSIPKTTPWRKEKKLLNMNWKQTQRRFPGLNPKGDIDFDGTINAKDCKPLDPARDGIFARLFGRQTKEEFKQERAKAKEYRKQGRGWSVARIRAKKEMARVAKLRRAGRPMRETVLKEIRAKEKRQRGRMEAIRKFAKKPFPRTREFVKETGTEMGKADVSGRTFQRVITGAIKRTKGGVKYTLPGGITYGKRKVTGSKGKGVGRPRMSYKTRVHPITGRVQPIPVHVYRKLKTLAKRQRRTVASGVQRQQEMQMARRGIPPQVAERMRQIRAMRIQQQVQQMPTQQMPTQYQHMYRRQLQPVERARPAVQLPQQPQYRVVTDIFTGRKTIHQLPPKERWTNSRRI